MGTYFGPLKVKKSFLGGTKVKAMYLGNIKIWVGTEQINVPTISGTYTYNGAAQTAVWSGYDSTKMSISGDYVGTNAGNYTAGFTPKEGYSWDTEGEDVSTRYVTWNIAQKSINGATITLGSALTYNGSEQTQTVNSVIIDSLSATYTVANNTGTNAGNYTLTCTGTGNFTGNQTKQFTINVLSITIPSQKDAITYSSVSQSPSWNDYNTTYMTIGGTLSSTDAGNYNATFDLKDKNNTQWSDSTTTIKTVQWVISPKSISGATITLNNSLTYNGGEQIQYVAAVIIDSLTATYTVSGNKQTNAGTYTLTCTGSGNFTGTQTKQYSIAQKNINGAIVTLSDTSKTYSGSTQSVSISSVVIDSLIATFTTSGTTSATNVGTYTVTATGNGNFTGTASNSWTIDKLSLTIPTLSDTSKTYTGNAQAPTINNFNSTWETQSGTASATNAGGPWTITWSLKDTTNTQWTDDTIESKSDTWSIAKAAGTLSINPSSVTFSISSKTATVAVTSNCLGSITVGSLSGVTSSVSGSTITLTGNGTTAISGGTMTVSVTPDSNHTAPTSVSITVNASYVYNITCTLSNCTATSGNPTTIAVGGTATLKFTANSGYMLPTSVTVSGATQSWTKASGTLVLSNPTAAVSVTISAPVEAPDAYVVLSSGSTWTVPTAMRGKKAKFAIFSGFQGGQGGYNGSGYPSSRTQSGGSGGASAAGGTQCKYYLTPFITLGSSYSTSFGTGGAGGSVEGGTGSIGGATTIGSYSSSNGSTISSAVANLVDSSITYNKSGDASAAGAAGGRGGSYSTGSAGGDYETWTGGAGGGCYALMYGGGGGGGAAHGANGSAGAYGSDGTGGAGASATAPTQAELGKCGHGGYPGGGGGGGGRGSGTAAYGAAGGSGSVGGQGSNGMVVVYYIS